MRFIVRAMFITILAHPAAASTLTLSGPPNIVPDTQQTEPAQYRDRKGERDLKRSRERKPDRGRYKDRPRRTHPGPIWRGPKRAVPAHRVRRYRRLVIIRPHGHFYHGYGHYHADSDAFRWLAFTAITLKILDILNEQQQRVHESAQVKATSAPVGETIHWKDGGASGSVTATREGTSSFGRYCREFQQTITVGGKTEQAYGTACRQPDGSWEIVSTGK